MKRLMASSESRRSPSGRSATFAERTATNPLNRRSGVILVVAMICLFLTSAMLGLVLKLAVAQRRYGAMEAAALQAEWLAESALDRAAAALSLDASYTGETWNVPAEDLDAAHAGRAVIEVVPIKGDNQQRELKVVAYYPAEGTERVKRTKRIFIAVSPSADNASNPSPAQAEKPAR